MTSLISDLVLPFLGVVLIVFSILSFFLPYGEKIKGKIQKIKAFGVDVELSVLTLIILVGLILSFTGMYVQIQDYDNQLNLAKADQLALQKALERAQKFQVNVLLTLEDVTADDMPKPDDLECEYHIMGEEQPVKVRVNEGYAFHEFRITLTDITTKTAIRSLILKDLSTNRKWAYNKVIMPLEPSYTLKKVEQM